VKIALDAMGGDFGPPALVAGSVMALREYPRIDKLFLVGDSPKIEAELKKHACNDARSRDRPLDAGRRDVRTNRSSRSGERRIRRSAARLIL
jgi:glycerol-3-phosphate acyltransferase PlsX